MSLRHRWEAYRELARHYRTVFRHYWNERDALDGNQFSEHEAEFLPAALSLQEKPVSLTARLTGRLLIALIFIVLAWSILGQVDIIVNATGKIIPNGHTKTLASVEVASVRALHVEDGQAVKAGDVLIELDSRSSDAERDKATGDENVARLLVARSEALLVAVNSLTPPKLPPVSGVAVDQWQAEQRHLDGQFQDFRAKLTRIDGDIQRYAQALPLAAKRARDYRELSENRDVSLHAYMEKEQARIDLEGQLVDARNQHTTLIAQTKKEAHDALTEGKKAAGASRQDAVRAGSHSELLKLTAPVNGTVQQLAIHTVGGVVPAAQPLMVVVPRENQVEVEAFLENKDIGFVQEGQPAEVKIDAYEYTKYGTVRGQVTRVSRDAIQDEKKGLIYLVKVTLDRSTLAVDGKNVPLTPGMSVSVEIKTGERRLIEYVLSPLMQHQRESLHER
jgi:hemolysin D